MAFLDHSNAINRKEDKMKELNLEKMNGIMGGVSITGTFINALVRGIDVLLDLGRSLGSALRKSKENTLCPL